jgi:hypothetical protein
VTLLDRGSDTIEYTAACPHCGLDATWTGERVYTMSYTGERCQHVEVTVDPCIEHGAVTRSAY